MSQNPTHFTATVQPLPTRDGQQRAGLGSLTVTASQIEVHVSGDYSLDTAADIDALLSTLQHARAALTAGGDL